MSSATAADTCYMSNSSDPFAAMAGFADRRIVAYCVRQQTGGWACVVFTRGVWSSADCKNSEEAHRALQLWTHAQLVFRYTDISQLDEVLASLNPELAPPFPEGGLASMRTEPSHTGPGGVPVLRTFRKAG